MSSQVSDTDKATIDTFLFDIGNVLVTFDFSKAIKFALEHSSSTEAEISSAVQELIVPLETGQLDGETFLDQLSQRIGYEGDANTLRQAYQDIFESNDPMRDIVNFLATNYRLVLFSNTSDLHKDWLFANYPVFGHFDEGIFSFVSGAMKPDDGMYLDAIHSLEIEPSRTIYLDDAPANIETGMRHGFRAVQYLPETHDQVVRKIQEMNVDLTP